MTETLAPYGAATAEKDIVNDLLDRVVHDLRAELVNAHINHPESYRNGHEVCGLICEELDEFFDLGRRDCPVGIAYEAELLRVAVVAFAGGRCTGTGGR